MRTGQYGGKAIDSAVPSPSSLPSRGGIPKPHVAQRVWDNTTSCAEGAPNMPGPYPNALAEALSPLIPPWRLAELGRSEDAEVREAVAAVTWCLDAVLTALAADTAAADTAAAVSLEAVKNPNCPPEALAAAATRTEAAVREAVASHRVTSAEVLSGLGADALSEVREAVAHNMWTPPDVLDTLRLDSSESVAVAVAGNSAAPAALLGRLGNAASYAVRAAVAHNPSAGADTLKRLSREAGGACGRRWLATTTLMRRCL